MLIAFLLRGLLSDFCDIMLSDSPKNEHKSGKGVDSSFSRDCLRSKLNEAYVPLEVQIGTMSTNQRSCQFTIETNQLIVKECFSNDGLRTMGILFEV